MRDKGRHAYFDDEPRWPVEDVRGFRILAYVVGIAWIVAALLCIAFVIAVIWLAFSLVMAIGG